MQGALQTVAAGATHSGRSAWWGGLRPPPPGPRPPQDKACKEFEPEFKLELFLDKVDEVDGEFDAVAEGGGGAGDGDDGDDEDDAADDD